MSYKALTPLEELKAAIEQARTIVKNDDLLWRTKYQAIFALDIDLKARIAGFSVEDYFHFADSHQNNLIRYMKAVDKLAGSLDNATVHQTIRVCPLEDGTTVFHKYDEATEDYVRISAAIALESLASNETAVEIAVPDPHDKHSHYESSPSLMRRI